MKVIKRAKVKIPYTNAKGEEKNDWVEIGSMWRSGDDVWLQLNALPLHREKWDGKVSLFDTDEKQSQQAKQGISQAKAVLDNSALQQQEIPEDDIPF